MIFHSFFSIFSCTHFKKKYSKVKGGERRGEEVVVGSFILLFGNILCLFFFGFSFPIQTNLMGQILFCLYWK